MLKRADAEHSRRPEVVLVHDPLPFGALEALRPVPAGMLTEKFLFREHPDFEGFAAQHRAFTETISAAGVTCQPLAELVGDVPCFAAARTDPNLMFTRDAAITLPWAPDVYLSARMAKPLRRPEVAIMSAASERLGLTRVEWGGPGIAVRYETAVHVASINIWLRDLERPI